MPAKFFFSSRFFFLKKRRQLKMFKIWGRGLKAISEGVGVVLKASGGHNFFSEGGSPPPAPPLAHLWAIGFFCSKILTKRLPKLHLQQQMASVMVTLKDFYVLELRSIIYSINVRREQEMILFIYPTLLPRKEIMSTLYLPPCFT